MQRDLPIRNGLARIIQFLQIHNGACWVAVPLDEVSLDVAGGNLDPFRRRLHPENPLQSSLAVALPEVRLDRVYDDPRFPPALEVRASCPGHDREVGEDNRLEVALATVAEEIGVVARKMRA
jgi:hypothetical protein